ncbi:MAG TPA: hypothetical protein VG329_02010 [Candidatus Dormibacteraeota bacterium]|nr:hypothetical protein [Candidatus Dormibacteraeota bacterium]
MNEYKVELDPAGVVMARSEVPLMTRRVAGPFCHDIQERAIEADARGLVMDLDSLTRATPRAAFYAMRSMKRMAVHRIAFTGGNRFMLVLARLILTLGGFPEFRFFKDRPAAVDWAGGAAS